MASSRKRLRFLHAAALAAGVLLAGAPRLAEAASLADATRVSSPIVVDGTADAAWGGRLTQSISKVVLGTVSSSTDLSGSYGVLWDADYLYLLVEVKDDSLRNDSSAVFDDDGVDLYLDLAHDKGTVYGPDDFMFQFGQGDTLVQEAKHNATTGASVASVPITGGYRLEARIPWSTLGKTPTAGMVIGLDVFLNDDDDGGGRDGQMSWNSVDANAYLYPDRFGDCRLVTSTGPTPGYTPAASTATPIVIDGSADAAWSGQVANPISKLVLGTVGSAADLSATYSALWDSAYLYLLVDVTDDALRNDSATGSDDDSVDLYLDLNHDAGTAYGADDFMFNVGYGDTTVKEWKHNATAGVQVASVARTGGYRLEVRIPWNTLGATPVSGRVFGLDVMVNDDDDGGGRDGQLSWNSFDANAYQYPDRFGDCELTGGPTDPPPPPPASRGATVPWRTYEAEASATNGTVVSTNQLGMEASGGRGITLDATGEYLEFVSEAEANRLVLRYSIPAGTSGTLSLYVNGVHRLDLPVRSDKLYETKNGTKTLRFYDEVDVATAIHEGDVVRLRKDAGDTVAAYTIDLVDLEWAPAPGTMPAGYLSVTSYGATPDDTTDDWAAIDSALRAGQAQGKGVWFPPGTFRQSKALAVPAGVKVKGAGLWHTKLFSYIEPPDTEIGTLGGLNIMGNDVSISDLRLTSAITKRLYTRPAISDHNGASNYRVENVWVEYFNTGLWLVGGYKGVVRSNRVRLTYADALHADYAERDTLFENNHVRGCGDDGIATVATIPTHTQAGPAMNIIARFNTIVANYWGRGMAVVGGTNILYEDNVIQDQAYAAGMLIATEPSFATYGIDGVTYRRNTILRSGGESYLGTGHGAVTVSVERSGVQALNVNVLNNEVRNAKRSAVLVNGSQYQQTTIRFNTLIAPSSTAIVNSATAGNIVISDNVVQ